MLWRQVQTILVPAAVISGYVLTSMAGGFISDVWDGFLGPFLITYWAGLGFTNAWYFTRQSMREHGFTPGMQAGTALLNIVVFLFMFDGPAAFIDDPWLIGVVIAPGLELIVPYLQHRHERTEPAGEE